MVYAEHLLSFWSLEFWCRLGRRCLRDQPPRNTLDAESVMSFPGRQYFTIVTVRCWRNFANPLWLHWERTLACLSLASSRITFADFALSPFTVINHSCEYNCMQNPMSSPSESSNLGVAFKIPDTTRLPTPRLYKLLASFHTRKALNQTN